MREVEAKVRIDDLGALRAQLGKLPAASRQVDTYFQHPCRDHAATDEALRIRQEGDAFTLTYKGPREGSAGLKARVEHNVATAIDPTPILEALGFTPAATVEKRRQEIAYGDVLVCLDDVAGLGTFVEVEAMPDADDPVAAVEDALRRLGLDGLPLLTTSYLEMLR